MPSTQTDRYGLLTIIEDRPSVRDRGGKSLRMVFVRCECGGSVVVRFKNLRSGNTKSCGCRKKVARDKANAERATPQAWTINGDVASIDIKDCTVLIDAADVPLVSQYRWHMASPYGYVWSMNRGARVAMHRLILGLAAGDGREADHKHHRPWDNRRSEIRSVNSSQNKMNQRPALGCTSIYKGVDWDADRQRFRAQIKVGSEHKFLGRFVDEIEAAKAYDKSAAAAFGEYAYLNFQGGKHAVHADR